MEIFLIVLCIMSFAQLVLTALILLFLMLKPTSSKSSEKSVTPIQEESMTEDELKEFFDADQEAAQGFRDAISNLNAFMTGNEEDSNVGKQNE